MKFIIIKRWHTFAKYDCASSIIIWLNRKFSRTPCVCPNKHLSSSYIWNQKIQQNMRPHGKQLTLLPNIISFKWLVIINSWTLSPELSGWWMIGNGGSSPACCCLPTLLHRINHLAKYPLEIITCEIRYFSHKCESFYKYLGDDVNTSYEIFHENKCGRNRQKNIEYYAKFYLI